MTYISKFLLTLHNKIMDPLDETKIVSDHIYTSLHYDIEPATYVTIEDEVNDTCRICLQNNAITNWDDEIVEFCDMSFKDFYYKFTQLEMLAEEDPFPKMLCQTCLTELKSAHFLMVKTLESYAVLRGTHLDNAKLICNENKTKEGNVITNDKTKSKCLPQGLNTLIKQNEELAKAIGKLNKTLEKTESGYNSPKGIDYSTYMLNMTQSSKNSNTSSFQEEINSNSKKRKLFIEDDSDNQELDTISEGEISKMEQNKPELHKEIIHKGYKKITDFEDSLSYEEDTLDFNDLIEETLENLSDDKSDDEESIKSYSKEASAQQQYIKSKPNKKCNKILMNSGSKQKLVCAFCPRLLADKKSLDKHEQTHDKNRERKATCPHCGVKVYTQYQLKLHIRTHSLQREKKHKCEFCDKAYYERGGLNIHRRIHLGQMFPCTMCSKEYYRQQDLDVHKVKAHGVAPIHGNVKLRTKYFIHCNECNKTLRTTSWKAHQANHLKIPLLKCSLCDIDFYTREALKWHMGKVHRYKKREEYEQHIVYLKDKRLSHKLLQQQKLLLQPNAPEIP